MKKRIELAAAAIMLAAAASTAAAFDHEKAQAAISASLAESGMKAPADAAPALTEAHAARSADIDTKLMEAIKLRQSIRGLLNARGSRQRKEIVAKAEGGSSSSFGGAMFLGIGGAGGSSASSFSAEAYQILLEGGEFYTLWQADDGLKSLAAAARAEMKARGIAQCPSIVNVASSIENADGVMAQLTPQLEEFRKVMDGLEPVVALGKVSKQQKQVYAALRIWAANSQIKVQTSSLTTGWAVKDADKPGELHLCLGGTNHSYVGPDQHEHANGFVGTPLYCNGGVDWFWSYATKLSDREMAIY